MDVLTFETCWALNNEIIKQVTSSWSIFIQHPQVSDSHCQKTSRGFSDTWCYRGCEQQHYTYVLSIRPCRQPDDADGRFPLYTKPTMTYQKADILLHLKLFRRFFERIAETNSTDGHFRNETDVAAVSLSVNETINEGNVTSVLILLWCKVKKTWPWKAWTEDWNPDLPNKKLTRRSSVRGD